MQTVRSRADFISTGSSVSNVTVATFLVGRRHTQDIGKWTNFKRFIWNKENRMCCNRTCSSWCKIIFFYLVFLCLLSGLFLTLLIGATDYIIENFKLPWIDKRSLVVGSNPGVAFIPHIRKTNSPLLWYAFQGRRSQTSMKYFEYVEYINNYFEKYDEAEKHKQDYSDCSISKAQNKSCIFLRKYLGPCGKNMFGYDVKNPCIYIKMNKLPEWVPEYYEGNDLPEEMPDSLKEVIKADSYKKKLWIHCEGIVPPDDEHMGKVSYYPQQGFMGYYFPYNGNRSYLTPLVAVKLDNVKKGYVVDIRCSTWAKNIKYDNYRSHSTDIQLYLAIN